MKAKIPGKFKPGDRVIIPKWERMPIFPFRDVRFLGKIVSGPDRKGKYRVLFLRYQIRGSQVWKHGHTDYDYVSEIIQNDLKIYRPKKRI